MRILALVLPVALGLSGCGAERLLSEGEQCTTSAECGAGLLCDYGQSPPKCAKQSSLSRDMASPTPPDEGVVEDLASHD